MNPFVLLLLSAQATAPFVPADFRVPAELVKSEYVLEPLGPKHAKLDYDAYMGSIEHIRANFSSGRWPTKDITMADAVKDVEGEAKRFAERKSFTYAVLTPDRKRELGCVYIQPSRTAGYGAQVRMWVVETEFKRGFQGRLETDVRQWLAAAWPFQKILFQNK
jgi:hypothetical protein